MITNIFSTSMRTVSLQHLSSADLHTNRDSVQIELCYNPFNSCTMIQMQMNFTGRERWNCDQEHDLLY